MDIQLERRYGLPTAICMVVGIVMGSGVFFKAEAVLQATIKDVAALAGVSSSTVSSSTATSPLTRTWPWA